MLVVTGILASVAAPRFLSMSTFDANQAHRQALSDLRFAHHRALTLGCPIQVDFASTSYALTERTSCQTGSFTQAIKDPSTNIAPFSITLPGSTTVSSTVDPIVFDTLGRVTTSAGVVTDATITIGGRTLEAIGETGLIREP